jgi:tetratricopeptide (TPR) repeat protein
MRKKINTVMFIGVSGVFLLCCLAACSPLKKMVNWIPFRGNEKPQYGLTDKEIEKFRHTIKIVNSDPESHYRLACFYQEKKKHPLAIEEFKKALQNDSAYVKAYNGLGVSYDLLGEFPSALKAYEAALRFNPDLAYVHNNLGYSYLLQKKFDLAIKAFQQAIALEKENTQYHNNLGLAYGNQGKYDLAFNEFKCAGNEEKARRHMAQLFNQKPGMYSAATLVAENLPQDDNQGAGKEKLAQTALSDQGIREENLEASASGNLSPEDYKQSDEPKNVVFSKNIETSTQPSFPVDEAQSLSNNLKKSHSNRQSLSDDVEIQISNGNGVRHFARRVGSYLTKKGFKVTSLKNEPRFNKLKTKIYYCDGYLQDAYSLAKQIPQHQEVVKVTGFKNRDIKIRIVVGKDMASYYKMFKAEQLRSL